MKNLELKDKFVELRAEGKSFASISAELGVSKSTLIEWSKDLEIDIKNLRQIHLESIREKYRLSFERRIEIFSEQLQSVETELSKRGLSQLSTSQLFDLLFKFRDELNAIGGTLTFSNKQEGFGIEPISTISSWSV